MHDLMATPALGAKPQTIGTITITENNDIALASVAAMRGSEMACRDGVETLLGAVPGPGKAVLQPPKTEIAQGGFWIGPDQWIISAPMEDCEDLADQLEAKLTGIAAITEQSGAWAVFDVQGEKMHAMCALLCNIAIKKMTAGDARRTMLHHLGCFVIRQADTDHIRILGPRSSAGSLHHALVAAAMSVA